MRYRHHHRSDPLLPLLAVAGIAALVYSFLRDTPPRRLGGHMSRRRSGLAAIAPKVADECDEIATSNFVRPAGPESMRDRPRRGWDRVDEQVDESFPASDPPANY